MYIPSLYGHPAAVPLTDAAGAAFVVVPLYRYDANRRERERRSGILAAFGKTSSLFGEITEADWCAVHGALTAHADAVAVDVRIVCAVPQGDWGVQLCELTEAQINGGTLIKSGGEPASPAMDKVTSGSLCKLIDIAKVIRGDAPEIIVGYQKDGEEPVARRLRPTMLFQSKRKGLSRDRWPVAVICDDLDKEEPGKTFLLDRMISVSVPRPLSDAPTFPDDDIPF